MLIQCRRSLVDVRVLSKEIGYKVSKKVITPPLSTSERSEVDPTLQRGLPVALRSEHELSKAPDWGHFLRALSRRFNQLGLLLLDRVREAGH